MKFHFPNPFRRPERMIALDVELDGMHPSRIIQLSYLIIDGRRVRGKNMYFAAKAVNRYAKKVHGLSVYQLRKLSGGDIFACRADESTTISRIAASSSATTSRAICATCARNSPASA